MRPIDQRADTVRHFNRFYTRRIGALGAAHLGSEFSLTEVRVLYELAHRERPTASESRTRSDLDRGYLSRMLRAFKRRGLITTQAATPTIGATRSSRSPRPGAKPSRRSTKARATSVAEMLEPLSAAEQQRVLERDARHSRVRSSHARRQRRIRSKSPTRFARTVPATWAGSSTATACSIRRSTDGTSASRPSWRASSPTSSSNFDPARERCWIAERNGEIVGSIFVVAKTKTVAKLRLLLVEPSARGLGIGSRLVDEVVRFAREAGYKKIVLWTQRELISARKIYSRRRPGFELVGTPTEPSIELASARQRVAETCGAADWDECGAV